METDDALYEMIDGHRVEMPPMSVRAVMVASRIGSAMNAFARPKRLGEAFTELLVHLPLPGNVGRDRRPDVSFFCYPHAPSISPQDADASAWNLVPDLAVEVTSPSDRAEPQREKVIEYFLAGVRLVWVVYPSLRMIDVFESPTSVRAFGPEGVVTGEPVLPGFELSLADLFAPFAAPGL
jgi:Uma2 family endonuclease